MEKVKILFENKEYCICVKPVGVLSEYKEAQDNMISLLNAQGISAFPVHRLDQGVGGVMIYAKSKEVATKLTQQMQGREIQKEYFAVIHGCPTEWEAQWKDFLFRDQAKNKTFVVKRQRKGVKEASLTYQVLGTANREEDTISLVCIQLQTGRTHQIRAQFSSRGFPLYGDHKYGSRAKENEIALWSHQLTLPNDKIYKENPTFHNPWTVFQEQIEKEG